jgi:hypothetical protein
MFESAKRNTTVNNPAAFTGTKANHFFAPGILQLQSATPQQQKALPTFTADSFVSGNFPNFDVQYVVNGPKPKTGTLFITHKVFFTFPASMDAAARTKFQEDFATVIHDTWSNKHLLSLNIPNFAAHQCAVDVSAQVVDKPTDAHTTITVKDELHRPSVSPKAKQAGSETTHTGELKKTHAATEQLNDIDQFDHARQVGDFDIGCSKCEEGIAEVEKIIQAIPDMDDPTVPNVGITFVGRASADGNAQRNKELGLERAKAVSDKITNDIHPFGIMVQNTSGATNATLESKFRRVDVLIDDKHTDQPNLESQNQSAHEFGHMIGFGDEYVEETKDPKMNNATRFRGDKPTHYNDVVSMVDKKAADELHVMDNANIMAHGMDVKRGHYAYFVDALNKITANQLPVSGNNWKVE